MSAHPEPSPDVLDEVIDTRRHLHRNPEVSFAELATSRFIEEQLPGSYLFCFQPAEEIVSGAREMIAGGLFERHRPDVTIGLHMASWLPSGHVVTRPGLLWAGSDAFDITMRGPGG